MLVELNKSQCKKSALMGCNCCWQHGGAGEEKLFQEKKKEIENKRDQCYQKVK